MSVELETKTLVNLAKAVTSISLATIVSISIKDNELTISGYSEEATCFASLPCKVKNSGDEVGNINAALDAERLTAILSQLTDKTCKLDIKSKLSIKSGKRTLSSTLMNYVEPAIVEEPDSKEIELSLLANELSDAANIVTHSDLIWGRVVVTEGGCIAVGDGNWAAFSKLGDGVKVCASIISQRATSCISKFTKYFEKCKFGSKGLYIYGDGIKALIRTAAFEIPAYDSVLKKFTDGNEWGEVELLPLYTEINSASSSTQNDIVSISIKDGTLTTKVTSTAGSSFKSEVPIVAPNMAMDISGRCVVKVMKYLSDNLGKVKIALNTQGHICLVNGNRTVIIPSYMNSLTFKPE